ncbi:hypothetical protein PM082_015661 [Marasmius tenuissimus]|nr:hypothetical protein PM082_015661 [Marasmius tenuissimus]
MGAFLDDLDVVDCLFNAGIPVWYTRPISQSLDVRINKAVIFITENHWQMIELHSGYEVDLVEAQPTACVIYTGLANKAERYHTMANFVHLLLQYPSLFGSSEPQSSTSLLRTSLSSSSVVPGSSQGAPSWKSALEALSSYNSTLPAPDSVGGANPGAGPSDPKQVSHSKEMREVLQDFIQKSGLSLKPDNLDGIKPSWEGMKLEEGQLPSSRIVHEIMCELFELNFRQELLVLDSQLNGSSMSLFNRWCLLDACWVCSADRTPNISCSDGLGNDLIQGWSPYLAALPKVMSTWRISKPMELLNAFPNNKTAHNHYATVERVERALASSYTSATLDIFSHASVPHSL